jgi:hypothetical protein
MKAVFASLLFGAAVAAACAPAAKETPVIGAGGDECGAAHYQYLVGKTKSAIPAAPAGARWRVTCTTCPVTMDYAPTRLNIFFDEKTGIVREVRCG